MLDSSCRRAEPDADRAAGTAVVDAARGHDAGAADADRPPGEHSGADPAAEPAARRHRAVCARRHQQRPVHDAGDAEQHDARNGANHDAGSRPHDDTGNDERAAAWRARPQRQPDAGTACERARTKHDAGAEHDQPAIGDVDPASGIVGDLSSTDDRGE